MGESINLAEVFARPPAQGEGQELPAIPGERPADSQPPRESSRTSGSINVADLYGGHRGNREEPGFAGNVGRALYGGLTSAGGAIAGFGEYMMGSGGVSTWAREGLEAQSDAAFGSMGEGWQTGMRREWLPGGQGPSAWESPGAFLSALGTQVTAALPSLATSLIPGGLVAKGIQIAGGGMAAATAGAGVVTGALAGAQGGGSVWNGITEAIRTAPQAEVEQSQVYRDARNRGLDDAQAREEMARQGRTGAYPAIAAAVAAVTAGLLEGPLAANIATGQVRRLAQGFREGALAEARQEFIDSGSQEAFTQAGTTDSLGRPFDASRVAEAAVQGAVVGAGTGGAVGALVGPRFRQEDPAIAAAAQAQQPQAPPPAPQGPVQGAMGSTPSLAQTNAISAGAQMLGPLTPPGPPPGVDPAVAAAAQAQGAQQTPTAASATPQPVANPALGAATPATSGASIGIDPAVSAAAGAARPNENGSDIGVTAPGPAPTIPSANPMSGTPTVAPPAEGATIPPSPPEGAVVAPGTNGASPTPEGGAPQAIPAPAGADASVLAGRGVPPQEGRSFAASTMPMPAEPGDPTHIFNAGPAAQAVRQTMPEVEARVKALLPAEYSGAEARTEAQRIMGEVKAELAQQLGGEKRSVGQIVRLLLETAKPKLQALAQEAAQWDMANPDAAPDTRAEKADAAAEKYAAERKTDEKRLSKNQIGAAIEGTDSPESARGRAAMIRRLVKDATNVDAKTGQKGKNLPRTVDAMVNRIAKAGKDLPDFLTEIAQIRKENAGNGADVKGKRARLDAWAAKWLPEAEAKAAEEDAAAAQAEDQQANDLTARRAKVREVFDAHATDKPGQETPAEFRARVAAMDAAMTEALGFKSYEDRMKAVNDSNTRTESAAGSILWWLNYAQKEHATRDAEIRSNLVGAEVVMHGVAARPANDAEADPRPVTDDDIKGVVADLRAMAAERATAMGTGGDGNADESPSDVADIAAPSPEDAAIAAEDAGSDADTAPEPSQSPRVADAREAGSEADAEGPAYQAVTSREPAKVERPKSAERAAKGRAFAERQKAARAMDARENMKRHVDALRAKLKALTAGAPVDQGARAGLVRAIRTGVPYKLSDNYVGAMLFTPRGEGNRGLWDRQLWSAVKSRIGENTPVVFVSDEAWNDAFKGKGAEVKAIFVPNTTAEVARGKGPGTIAIPEATLQLDADARTEAVLHEALHAASTMTVSREGQHRLRVERLMATVADIVAADPDLSETLGDDFMQYALSDPDEFFAMAMTNADMQDVLANVTLTAEQARFVGVQPNVIDKITNAFKALVDMVRKALGLSPDTMSALEAAIRVTDKAVQSASQQQRTAQKDIAKGDATDSFSDDESMLKALPALNGMSEKVSQALKDAKINTRGNMGKMLGFLTLRQMEEIYGGLFQRTPRLALIDPNSKESPMVQVTKALNERAQIAEKFVETEFRPILRAMADLPQAQRAELSEFLHDATMANVHPDVPLSHAKNAHLRSAKGKQLDSVSARHARNQHPKLAARYAALNPAQQQTYQKVIATTERVHKQVLGSAVQDLIYRWWGVQVDQHLGKSAKALPMTHQQMEAMAKRFRDGVETATDKKVLESTATDDSWNKLIEQARNVAKIEGPYVPLQRTGDHVVTWQEDANPKKKFATKAAMEAYVDSSDLTPLSSRTIYYDAQGKEITGPDPAVLKAERAKELAKLPPTATQREKLDAINRGTRKARDAAKAGAARTEYEVTMQTQGVAHFNTAAEAAAFREELVKDGKPHVSERDLRKEPSAKSGMLDAALNGVINQIQKDDTLSAKARAELELSLSNALTQLTPNKMLASHRIKRRRVLGADRNMPHVLANYATGAANYYAAVQTTLPITSGLRSMGEQRDAERNANPTGADEGKTQARAEVLRELERRTQENAYDPAGRGSTSPVIRKMQSLAFVYYLASPAYSMIQMMQPYMFTAPYLSAKFGAGRSGAALAKAMNDIGMGSVLKGGLKDSATTFKNLIRGANQDTNADYLSQIKKQLARQADGAEVNAMLDELAREGLVDSSSGLELVRSLKAQEGKIASGLARAEAFARALPASIEAINRAGTAVAAYRLARDSGMNVPDARAYARKAVDNTQADYSSSNTARYMDPKFAGGWLAPMMTFRKFSQAVYFLLIRQTYLAVKGETPEVRREAWKTLGYTLLTHQLVAGTLGLPTEPLNIALGIIAFAMGADEPPDWEKEVRKVLADMFGAEMGEAVARGLPSLLNMDLSGRVGLNSLLFVKDLRDYQDRTLQQYAGEMILGAPGAMLGTMMQAPRHLWDGNYGRAFEAVTPKALRDAAKSLRIAEEGITTKRGERIDSGRAQNAWEVGLQALGITPASTREVYERRNAVQGENRRITVERTELMREWRQAAPAERAAIWRDKILPWNRQIPAEGARTRITMENLYQSLREQTRRKTASGQQDYLPRGREYLRNEGRFANVE